MKAAKLRLAPVIVETLEHRIAPATLFVTNTGDSGAGSLRQAILDANATDVPDTILFKPTAYGIITLTTGDLDITKSVTVKGPGASKVIISGNAASRIFNITDGNSGAIFNTTLSGLALVGGADANGGAVFSAESLTMTNCVISGNVTAGDGGGVYHRGDGKFVMTGCIVTGNTATDGGGLYIEAGGGVTITKTIISNNSATTGKGGGAYLSTNGASDTKIKVTVTSSTFAGNFAATNGGGLDINGDGRNIAVLTSTFSGNNAGIDGGGLRVSNGSIAVQNTTAIGNSADRGGGIHVNGIAGLPVAIKASKFINNTATVTVGGGISFDGPISGGILTVVSSILSGNTAFTDGGGLAAIEGGTVTVTATKFLGNRSTDDGGGIFTDGAAASSVILSVTGGTFSENTAEDGGGIFTEGDGAVTLKASKFISNHVSGQGGGFYLQSAAAISITSTLLSKNTAGGDGGGGITVTTGSTTITGLIALDNVAGGKGGGFGANAGTTSITKSLFRGNVAGTTGGGIDIFANTNITSSLVTGNISKGSGGGINRTAGTVTLTATKVSGNIAATNPDKNF